MSALERKQHIHSLEWEIVCRENNYIYIVMC